MISRADPAMLAEAMAKIDSESILCQPENPETIVLAPQVHAATVDKAVAAELRRLADEITPPFEQPIDERGYGAYYAKESAARRLRARANELDPTEPSE